ncbi:AMP-binding protein [Agrobacterium tumefaciens]|uniref:class I adenylate-forming enzyme family protein n=1 Tax=Agrobacterium fabrum TaxID=1176649 RepID=UPI00157314B9|nr:AMP-binding protein [Agrobacterium fabrum]NTE84562.1 AMP-binding protein [Agrobacterium tumefaciens]
MTRHDGLFPSGSSISDGGQDRHASRHERGFWTVSPDINKISPDVFYGSRRVRAFGKRPATYDAMFRAAVERNPEGEAVVCGARRISYRELDRLVDQTARGLVEEGLRPGDRVAVMLDNRLEFLQASLAIVRAGGISVSLGTRLGRDDVTYIVGDCDPTFAVTSGEWADRFPPDVLPRLFLVEGARDGSRPFSALSGAEDVALPDLEPEAVMMIVYTSGTTGKPKGACLTHVNFVHTCLHYLYALSIDAPLRSLLVVPGTHIAGFGPVMSTTLASAGTVVMMREFKARHVLEIIERERITFAVLVPAMYQLCLMDEMFGATGLSTWVYGVYGGAIMPPAVIERFAAGLPGLRMINAYGATETCAVCTIIPHELTREAPASVGIALHCDELRVVDEHGQDVGPGRSGELWIRGPNVSPGYWNNPMATEAAFSDGFWKSGDVASIDERGLVFIHDRLKDMINRGGFKVFSAEVENALMGHPGVADCAVVGVPDSVLGEKTFAYVQQRDPTLSAEVLRKYLKERIADYKVPDYWTVTNDAVPRNQNGKQQKADVRILAAKMREEQAHVR